MCTVTLWRSFLPVSSADSLEALLCLQEGERDQDGGVRPGKPHEERHYGQLEATQGSQHSASLKTLQSKLHIAPRKRTQGHLEPCHI